VLSWIEIALIGLRKLAFDNLAQALAFGMFVVLAAMMLIYIPLQRRAAKWAK